jgi:predicted glycogen debranching enzyme
VLTLQKADGAAVASLATAGRSIDELLGKEWLLTNGRGGYASSTVVGCNTNSYHGLLIGSLNPPVNRIMALANCLEMVIFKGGLSGPGAAENTNGENIFNLSTFEFQDKFTPRGFTLLRAFRRDIGVHFDYELGRLQLIKSVYLLRDADTVAIEYEFKNLREAVEFVVRPFVGLRDFHALQKSYTPLTCREEDDGIVVHHHTPGACELLLSCPGATFEKDSQWWFNFVYRVNRERGMDFTEDLWTPGFFRVRLSSPGKIVFTAALGPRFRPGQMPGIDIDSVRENLRSHHRSVMEHLPKNSGGELGTLYLAADQFITQRQTPVEGGTTIMAGYPWFADWGRDAFISLPGLMLATERFDEARSVLTTFAAAADAGMIPNRFDDEAGAAHFNSVDASLWFINAAFEYLNATSDSQTFTQDLLPTIRWIIDSYRDGTRFEIRADGDGLITAGGSDTQLTWMDARYDGVAFTPRYGKAVEVNALWHNALCLLTRFYSKRNVENANRYKAMADQAASSFGRLFWNDERRYLNDCILPDGSADTSLRPNQIFAVSLPCSALTREQQKAVVNTVREHLLTPLGLRTLNTQDERYRGACAGPPQERDEAYHQGTVWPYLIGPFVEAYLKVNEFSRKSKKSAAQFIQPLLEHLTQDACLGSISEIFDGDAPHKPAGCIAQAWSVAELIRAYRLING